MGTGSIIIAVLIAIWGALEYERRERNHKKLLDALRAGRGMPTRGRFPSLSVLCGEGLVAVLLAGTSAFMLSAGLRTAIPGPVLIGMGVLFAVMMLLVCLMLVRDVRLRRQPSTKIGGTNP